jgi:hypothetical protein
MATTDASFPATIGPCPVLHGEYLRRLGARHDFGWRQPFDQRLYVNARQDATGVICKLADELAKPDGLFNGVSQIGSFELREPLSAESLQFFRIIEATDGDELRYRLEMQQA